MNKMFRILHCFSLQSTLSFIKVLCKINIYIIDSAMLSVKIYMKWFHNCFSVSVYYLFSSLLIFFMYLYQCAMLDLLNKSESINKQKCICYFTELLTSPLTKLPNCFYTSFDFQYHLLFNLLA